MRFTYEIKVNGLFMDSAPTMKGALAIVSRRFHMRPGVTIEARGVVVWKSDDGR